MVSPITRQQQLRRPRRALAHACQSCRRPWALRVVDHPAGKVVVCRFCSHVRSFVPLPRPRLGTA